MLIGGKSSWISCEAKAQMHFVEGWILIRETSFEHLRATSPQSKISFRVRQLKIIEYRWVDQHAARALKIPPAYFTVKLKLKSTKRTQKYFVRDGWRRYLVAFLPSYHFILIVFPRLYGTPISTPYSRVYFPYFHSLWFLNFVIIANLEHFCYQPWNQWDTFQTRSETSVFSKRCTCSELFTAFKITREGQLCILFSPWWCEIITLIL